MKYLEFKRASERHYNTCKFLCEELSKLKDTKDAKKKQLLLHNVYYLSGYIVETLLSYIFFFSMSYKGEIEKSEHYKNQSFKTHDLNRKLLYVSQIGHCNLNGIPFLGKKENISYMNLFNNWSVELRYQELHTLKNIKYTEADMRGYIDAIGNMKCIVLRRFM